MVETEQNRVQLGTSPATAWCKASSPKSFQEARLDGERINVLDLKAQVMKRVGRRRAKIYFAQFVAFISSHLSKRELDKLVVLTFGKDNVPLHNQLVKAILSNAVKGRTPPSPYLHRIKARSKHQSPSVTSNARIPHTSPSDLSTGDSFLSSPRSPRSTARPSQERDYRVSPIGQSDAHSALAYSQATQHLDNLTKHVDAESTRSLEPPTKRARIDCSVSDDSVSGVESEIVCGEENAHHKEEKDATLPPFHAGSSIKEPFGLPFLKSRNPCKQPSLHAFPARLLRQSGLDHAIKGASDLPDGDTMHSLIEKAAIGEGLEGASRECANILNVALDAYLKRLIKSCGAVRGTQAGITGDCTSNDSCVCDNGDAGMMWPNTNGACMRHVTEPFERNGQLMISIADLKVAMDKNPWQLGDNWAVQLERISFLFFDQ